MTNVAPENHPAEGAIVVARFARGVDEFLDVVEAIRDIANHAETGMADLDNPERTIRRALDQPYLPLQEPDRSDAIDQLIPRILEVISLRREWIAAGRPPSRRGAPDAADETTTMDSTSREALDVTIDGTMDYALEAWNIDPARMLRFVQECDSALSQPRRHDLLLRSLLINAVGAFEAFFTSLARSYYRARPDAILADDQALRWSDLKQYSTIEEFQEHFISSKVDDLSRSGFEEWRRWTEDLLSVSASDWGAPDEVFRELLQRRHVYVHSGGRVTHRYLKHCTFEGSAPRINQRLPIDEKYLENALQVLAAAAIVLAFRAMIKLNRSDRAGLERADHFANLTPYRELQQGRHSLVLWVTESIEPYLFSSSIKNMNQVNKWLAWRESHGNVHPDVARWDTESLQDNFKMAKLVLEDKFDDAEQLMRRMLDSGALSAFELESWPLMRRLKGHLDRRSS